MTHGVWRHVDSAEGWFVDLPLVAKPLCERKALRLTISPEETGPGDIHLRGVAVKRHEGWVVVSCDGLLASGPTDHASVLAPGTVAHVRVLCR